MFKFEADTSDNLFGYDQYRLARLQVFRWGTFENKVSIDVSKKGHLFFGGNGSGKSTLSDAFSVVLIPRMWLNLNSAAREDGKRTRERTLMTYVRGAIGSLRDESDGSFTKRYLRTGSTCSAVALTFHAGENTSITLVVLLHVAGNSTDVRDLKEKFLIFPRDFDLAELTPAMNSGAYDKKSLAKFYPDAAHISSDFMSYCEHFCGVFRIGDAGALRLLHKAQSFKSQGDINAFMRDFMLDVPASLDAAKKVVTQFEALESAYARLVDARKQIEVLSPARDNWKTKQEQEKRTFLLNRELEGVNRYRDEIIIAALGRTLSAQKEQLRLAAVEVGALSDEIKQKNALLTGLMTQFYQAGGGDIQRLETQRDESKRFLAVATENRDRLIKACRMHDWKEPESAQAFAQIVLTADERAAACDELKTAIDEKRVALLTARTGYETARNAHRATLRELSNRRTNIPVELVRLREQIVQATGIPESNLPFAGELIDVRPDAAGLQGGIERVLRPFAVSLLVEDRYWEKVAAYLNSNTLEQAPRVRFHRVQQSEAGVGSYSEPTGSILHAVEVKPCVWQRWVQGWLHQHCSFVCVTDLEDLKATALAFTAEGLVHAGESRYEKDDTYPLGDPMHWVLGCDNTAKLKRLEEEVRNCSEKIDGIDEDLRRLTKEDEKRQKSLDACRSISSFQWQDVDVASVEAAIRELEKSIAALRQGNVSIQTLESQIKEINTQIASLTDSLDKAQKRKSRAEMAIETNELELDEANENLSLPLDSQQESMLRQRFAKAPDVHNAKTSREVYDRANEVTRSINEEITICREEIQRCGGEIVSAFAKFKDKWPVDAGDLAPSLSCVDGFLDILARVETEGLHRCERDFLKYVGETSTNGLRLLYTSINGERKEIRNRLKIVNESLSGVPFSTSKNGEFTTLQIKPGNRRRSDEYAEFESLYTEISSGSLDKSDLEDMEKAEDRYRLIKRLIGKLRSDAPEDVRWCTRVLDVRQHFDFYASECNAAGEEVEAYRSGESKSGGQRQKLAATCMAAALRYKLGGHNRGLPVFGCVVLDEAMDKSDAEFTRLSLNIFREFGFQLVLASPGRAVVFKEFTGSASIVELSQGEDAKPRSLVTTLTYDEERECFVQPDASPDEPVAEPHEVAA